MRLILDNNILFSVIKPDSTNAFFFDNMNADLFAPSFIKDEFNKYEKECLIKSGLSRKEFSERKKTIFSRINFIELNSFNNFTKIAEKFCPDKNDIFYFALALKLDVPIWSNDKNLKNQDKIKVISTEDLLNIFF